VHIKTLMLDSPYPAINGIKVKGQWGAKLLSHEFAYWRFKMW